MKSKKNLISDYVEKSIQTKKEVLNTRVKVIAQIAKEIIDAHKRGNKVLWFGNGGSAADAQHLACDLVSKFYLEKRRFTIGPNVPTKWGHPKERRAKRRRMALFKNQVDRVKMSQ